MKTINVVAAIIKAVNEQGAPIIFATQRGYGDFKGGWEFPGGKIEAGETPEEALIREIREELDTEIAVGELLDTIEYDYPNFHLSMKCYWSSILSGDLVLKEHEAARWLTKEELFEVAWLPADIGLVGKIEEEMEMDKMNNLYTLKVYPAGLGRTVYRVIEIAGNETLDKLCETILDAYDFTYDHLYEFCMDNKMYGRNSYQCEPMEGEPSTKTAIDEIWLSKGQNFSLHYDFGDDWMFTIHVQKIEELHKYKQPEVIKEKGQIEQYPDYEDEEYDEFFDEDFED